MSFIFEIDFVTLKAEFVQILKENTLSVFITWFYEMPGAEEGF